GAPRPGEAAPDTDWTRTAQGADSERARGLAGRLPSPVRDARCIAACRGGVRDSRSDVRPAALAYRAGIRAGRPDFLRHTLRRQDHDHREWDSPIDPVLSVRPFREVARPRAPGSRPRSVVPQR